MSRDMKAMNRALSHVAEDVAREIKSIKPDEAVRARDRVSEELENLFRQYPTTGMIEGDVGLGKSTVAGIIKRAARIQRLSEAVDNNLILDKYYDDMAVYGPMLQSHLINDRLMTLMHFKRTHQDTSLVSDRSPYGDPWAFCEALCRQGLMSEDVKNFCQTYFKWRKQDIESRFGVRLEPDLIILLQQENVNVGWQRAQERDRKTEMRADAKKGRGLTIDFYTALHEEYRSRFLNALSSSDVYGGAVLPLPQDDVEVSNADTIKGELYVLRAVKDALGILHGFPSS